MYARANLYQTYHKDSILTASPIELVVMLYEALIKNLKLAKIHIESKNYEKANTALIKCQDILTELMRSLDLKYALASQLLSIYEYMTHEMISINIRKDVTNIDSMVEMLDELKEAWKVIKPDAGLLLQEGLMP